MSDHKIYPIKPRIAENAHVNVEQYHLLYQQSIQHPEAFWAEQANKFLDWHSPWHTVLDCDFSTAKIRWFEGGKLNVSVNCLDRHLTTKANETAIIWEGDNPENSKKLTYLQLHEQVCRFANVLKNQGVKKADRVCIYMPMILEVSVVMLACTRIGVVHSIVFGGFSAESLKERILDCDCEFVVCADEGYRGGKVLPMKSTVDKALENCLNVKKVIVVKNTDTLVNFQNNRDVWFHEEMEKAAPICEPEWMDAEDPLFILHTSGSTKRVHKN